MFYKFFIFLLLLIELKKDILIYLKIINNWTYIKSNKKI